MHFQRYAPLGICIAWAIQVKGFVTVRRHLHPTLLRNLSETAVLSIETQETLQEMATDALLPVLYQEPQKTMIRPEKALKKLLRRYQSSLEKDTETTTTLEERQATRKYLSNLVLGTSVLRLRYFYLLQESVGHLEPIFGWEETVEAPDLDPRMSQHEIVHQIVQLHAQSLQEEVVPSFPIPITVESIAWYHSLPSFLSQRLVQQYGLETAEALASHCNEPGPITLRRNAIQCPSDDMLTERLLNEDSLHVFRLNSLSKSEDGDTSIPVPEGCLRVSSPQERNKSIWSLQAWNDGWFEVQDVGSQVIVDAMDVSPGETIVDFCAGNGGKTLAIASRVLIGTEEGGEMSRIIAHDVSLDRLSRLRGSLGRAGVSPGAITTTIDPHYLVESADVVLVDVPCSSSGTLRRSPSHRFELTDEEIVDHFPKLQLEILNQAARSTKIGGRLVYSTCSILNFENEQVVDAFESSPGFEKWKRWSFHESCDSCERPHCRALLPSSHESDGFFIARWIRVE